MYTFLHIYIFPRRQTPTPHPHPHHRPPKPTRCLAAWKGTTTTTKHIEDLRGEQDRPSTHNHL